MTLVTTLLDAEGSRVADLAARSRQRWQVELISESASELGGYKEVVVRIAGAGAYSRLKFESGGHRVQRVPETEAQGRIHTSACTVAVLPEAEDVLGTIQAAYARAMLVIRPTPGLPLPANLPVAERDAARAARDFVTADRIRDELAGLGVTLEDGPSGTIWHRT